MEDFGRNMLFVLGKMPVGKFRVCGFVNLADVHYLRALVEWSVVHKEHIGHHVFFAAGKNEMHVGELLNVFAKQSLHLTVGVVGNGLKLVKCHKAGLPRRFEIGEYLLQGGDRRLLTIVSIFL